MLITVISNFSNAKVRKKGQSLLFHMFLNFHYSYNLLLPEIVKNLTDPNVPEHKLKVSLWVLFVLVLNIIKIFFSSSLQPITLCI